MPNMPQSIEGAKYSDHDAMEDMEPGGLIAADAVSLALKQLWADAEAEAVPEDFAQLLHRLEIAAGAADGAEAAG